MRQQSIGQKCAAIICAALVVLIKSARTAIRYHRDQKGDDRCWLDDFVVWALVGVKRPRKLPSRREMGRMCGLFFVLRQRPGEPRKAGRGAIHDPARWDDDLKRHANHHWWLTREAYRLFHAMLLHWKTSLRRPLNWRDDERLYGVLPERLWADTRLPAESRFLRSEGLKRGEQKSCPRYWRSHQGCPASEDCVLTKWGPCGGNRRRAPKAS